VLFGRLNTLADKAMFGIDSWIIDPGELEAETIEGVHPSLLTDTNEVALERLDAKAGSLLTHISMMIAASSFMISFSETHIVEKVIVGSQMTFYLFLAILCVRCLVFQDLVRTRGNHGQLMLPDYRASVRLEVKRRALLLNFCTRWLFLITFVFAITVVVHLVL